MLQIVPQMRIYAACDPVDFRRGIDGLAAECRRRLGEDPFSGAVFLFRNRNCTAIKILVYDGIGFWLCHRRLSKGRLKWWPQGGKVALAARELQVLLWNGDPRSARFGKDWRGVLQSSLGA
jgi:transposase